MQLKLLCIGDVVGAPGRRVLQQALSTIVPLNEIDCVIVNAENTARGSGLTAQLHQKIISYGANLITLGDHIYRRREIIAVLEESDNIVRPANLPAAAPGREFAVYQTASSRRVAVISLLGRLYMKTQANCPFNAVDRVLAAVPKDVKTIVVDMHAEATSEKIAMGWHLDGRVSVVFGTHTHVQTADERILPKGTAYITDLGMTGPYDSILGRVKETVLGAMLTGVPNTLTVAKGEPRLCGVVVTVDASNGQATEIERICFDGIAEPDGL